MSEASESAPAAPVPFADRYWLTELIAVGGMAEVYLGKRVSDSGFEKEVVIKRLKPEIAGDSRVLQLFRHEARIGSLLSHPNVTQIFDSSTHEGVPYIAMEYVPGEELNQLCRRGLAAGMFLPLEVAVEIVRQAAWALGCCHAARTRDGRPLELIHCDISPTNLLVTGDGCVKLIDFGIAQSVVQGGLGEGAVPGKVSYMSPEQASGIPVDHRTDIFSLAVVLYEITVGQRLFRGPASDVIERVAAAKVEPPTFIDQDYPGHLEGIVLRGLERHPSDRYQSAFELADELGEFLRTRAYHTDALSVARYLDELAGQSGMPRRPELAVESGDDALDFDRGMLHGMTPMPDVGRSEEWDDIEEEAAEVARALGIEVGLVRGGTRSPTASQSLDLLAQAVAAALREEAGDDDEGEAADEVDTVSDGERPDSEGGA